jgi:CRP/FNR family transcriptional regulator, cyclic AMP receptor protein
MDIALLRKVKLFEGLNSAQLAKVAALGEERKVPAGEFVFKEGDTGAEMFIIESGRVRISKNVPGIGEEALAILDPGSYFGEMALIDDSTRSADAIVHAPLLAQVITKEALDELMFVDKEIAYILLWTFVRTLSERLRDTDDKIKAFFALSSFK